MTESIIEKLKHDVESSNLLVESMKRLYTQSKRYVALKEGELKNAKSSLYQAHKAWVYAKKSFAKSKNRLAAYPSKNRRYVKEHFGEVLERIGK